MSQEALADYQRARDRQLSKNEARHIYTRVREAREAPHLAGIRWPFELLQNALDAGPRPERDVVTVNLRQEDGQTIFQHDGAAFSAQELAALLSGGSSKDFGAEDTTGRFGTGFLVTHVLADRMSLQGLIALGRGYESFSLDINRSGDEEQILENIHQCSQAIERAEQIPDAEAVPSARFIYPMQNEETFALGIDAFRAALSYLYGTCPRLGNVHLTAPSLGDELWIPGQVSTIRMSGGIAWDRLIDVRRSGETYQYRILRFALSDKPRASALVLLESAGDIWQLGLPGDADARIYRQYPLRSSSFIPINFILDGAFEPDQERSIVLMNDSDRQALSEGFSAAALAAHYAFEHRFAGAHLLSKVDALNAGFNPTDQDETAWWLQQLAQLANVVGNFPIVQTASDAVPALPTDGVYADFVSPHLLNEVGAPDTSVDRLWPLLNEASDLIPPIKELAADWTAIADSWARLGVRANLVTVEGLASWVRGDTAEGSEAAEISELRVIGDKIDWLARYLDVVGECWHNRGGTDSEILRSLLPNQRGALCSPEKLRRDGGIADELKDICEAVGFDVRAGLLSTELSDSAGSATLRYAKSALSKAIPGSAQNEDIERELLDKLVKALPEDTMCSDDNTAVQLATASLLAYLWKAGGAAAEALARKVPLVAKSKKVVYWSSERMMMAPVGSWGQGAQAFSDAYPTDRVLDDLYAELDDTVVAALSAWGVAYPDPIVSTLVGSLDGARLANMVDKDFDSSGVTLRDERFSQIALLPREVMNHVQDQDQARALLGLVLMHVAPNDPLWRQWRTVNGSRARDIIEFRVRGGLWLGDLRSRAWIPVRGDDDSKPVKAGADVVTLRSLLDPAWIDGNPDAIELLTQCFEFDELELRLLGISPEVQGRVRQGLAKLLESGGGDPEFYEALAREAETRQQRKEDVARARSMGYAVQDAVRLALESYGLTVTLVDRGYDFEVTGAVMDDTLDLVATRFTVGPYFVEVKATTAGPVRLTPAQADKAASESSRYVLCVVDLRDLREHRFEQDWSEVDVASRVVMLDDIGDHVLGTFQLVQRARESDVGIRNETALRYEVPPQIWQGGVTVSEWVESIADDPVLRADGSG